MNYFSLKNMVGLLLPVNNNEAVNILGYSINLNEFFGSPEWNVLINLVISLLLSWIAYFFTRKILLRVVTKFIKKTKTNWDDVLLERRFFRKASWFAPAIIMYYYFSYLPEWKFTPLFQTILIVYMLILTMLLLNTLLNAANDIYNTFDISKQKPIKGFIQVVKIFLFSIVGIIIIAKLIDKSPTAIITGLGAFAAVLMLIFKDTILGFVAGIQLAANNMLKIGDWIAMPSHGADGTVIEISLNVIKIRNWDQTIVTIPSYRMVNESYINWRGMEESGGRRIKRSINVDIKSVRFLNDEDIEHFKKFKLLSGYMKEKTEELNKRNEGEDAAFNKTRMTNIGTFRAYLQEYIRQHPMISDDMTFMVRQLQATEKGLPIEVYGFSKIQSWVEYEVIQADIFDHILAIISEFDLRIYQFPTGSDLKFLKQ